MAASRILIIRLPCHKVYPTGPLYLLSLINKAAPQTKQQVLDLALSDRSRHVSLVARAVADFRPDVVAFSWRDVQIFSPQDLDGAMRDAFVFFHEPSLLGKLAAAFRGLRDILTFRSSLAHILHIIRKTAEANPGMKIALGGSSIRIFGRQLQSKLPGGVRVFTEAGLGSFFSWLGMVAPADLIEPAIDMDVLEAAFPQWEEYRGDVIGIQTKQGCPQDCLYCLYGFLEGKAVRHREPARVVAEIGGYARRWGARRFWLADAQLLSEPRDHVHLAAILEGTLQEGLAIEWSGYMRIHELDVPLASLMVRSGLRDLEVSLNSGAPGVLRELQLGFTVEQVMKGFEVLRQAGYAGRVLVNLSLNAPGETRETLRETIEAVKRIKRIFGDGRVMPVVFFLAVQPHTGLEQRALADGHLKQGYDPLSVMPWDVLKLIYNPPPLGGMIGRACARAFARGGDDVGERILGSIEAELQRRPAGGNAARGVAEVSGR